MRLILQVHILICLIENNGIVLICLVIIIIKIMILLIIRILFFLRTKWLRDVSFIISGSNWQFNFRFRPNYRGGYSKWWHALRFLFRRWWTFTILANTIYFRFTFQLHLDRFITSCSTYSDRARSNRSPLRRSFLTCFS